jgi:hypothetical protein
MPKLASCPFCGGEAIRWPAGELADEGIINELAGCYGNDPERRHPFLRMTPTAWNTRKSDDGWRTMESAPKDGSEVLAWAREAAGGRCTTVEWSRSRGSWIECYDLDGWMEGYGPTHWRPLPSPPEG